MNIVKIIGRTLVLLLAAALVIGGVNALSAAGGLTAAGGPAEGRFAPNHVLRAGAEASGTGVRPASFDLDGGDHENNGFDLSGLTTVAKNLAQMSVIVAGVTLAARVTRRLSRRRVRPTSAA